ncbi:hypothetical protein PISMIDRAFT_520232 [Pisolithus microcarpus 441]|uniref:Uncharacterized protein n=1 Tax=Pisolithus microcarpus 441 TaxID=765257 RepID=A0A0D0AB08_9AGAM|nr:hypothetical protein PISMIDRAFT_520232 [Pisolithus microcarpus 441]
MRRPTWRTKSGRMCEQVEAGDERRSLFTGVVDGDRVVKWCEGVKTRRAGPTQNQPKNSNKPRHYLGHTCHTPSHARTLPLFLFPRYSVPAKHCTLDATNVCIRGRVRAMQKACRGQRHHVILVLLTVTRR